MGMGWVVIEMFEMAIGMIGVGIGMVGMGMGIVGMGVLVGMVQPCSNSVGVAFS